MNKSNVVYMTIGMVRKAVTLCILAQKHMPAGKRFGAIVWSQSGIGKNGVTDNLAADMSAMSKKEWGSIDCNLAGGTPEDITGLPEIINGQTVYHSVYKLAKESYGIFRVDEIDRPAYFQNIIAMVKFGVDRTVTQPLPLNWFVLGLANGVSDAQTQELTEHIKGRFCHLYVSTNLPNADKEFAEYQKSRNTCDAIKRLLALNPIKTRDEFEAHAIYNKRTLEYADSLLKAYLQLKAIGQDYNDVLLPCLAGVIGKNEAIQLLRLQELESLPTLDEVIADPLNAMIPEDLSLRHTYLTVLVQEAQADCTKAVKLMDYLVRLPNEVARYSIEMLALSCSSVMTCKAYAIWMNRLTK
jgi:MoxR-like ATPase